MAIVVSDTFDRANNPTVLGTADTGQVWDQVSGNWGVNTNAALVSWDNGDPLTSIASIESGLVDGITSATLPSVDVPNFSAGIGIICRYVNADYYFRLLTFDFPGSAGVLRLQRVYNGSVTTAGVDIGPGATAPGDKISIACCGSLFDVLVNDVSVGTYDDSGSPQNYGTKSGIVNIAGTTFFAYTARFDDFLVETNDSCGSASASSSASVSASPSTSPSSSPSASPELPCTPPEGSAIACVNAGGQLLVTLINQDNESIAYAWHEGAERMPVTAMTNWKRSLRPLTLQELDIAFETDNANSDEPMVISVHRNLRQNYVRDASTTNGSNRIDSAAFDVDDDNIGDMIAVFGENVGGPGVNHLIGRIAAESSPSASPSPSSSVSASPSSSFSSSPSASPSSSPSSSRSSSASPSHSPSSSPSGSPSRSPSASPSITASASPSASPSGSPSTSESASPSSSPSASPSASS